VVSLCAEFPNDNPAIHRGVAWVCLDLTGAAQPLVEAFHEVEAPEAAPVVPTAIVVIGEVASEAVAVVEVNAEAEVVAVAVADAVAIAEIADALADPPAQSGIVLSDRSCDSEPSSLADLAADLAADVDAIVVEDIEPLGDAAVVEGVQCADAAPLESATLPAAPDDPFIVLVCALADVAIGVGSPYVASVVRPLLVDGCIEPGLSEAALSALEAGGILADCEVTSAFATTARAWREILRGTSEDFSACANTMLDEWCADLLARLLGAPDRTAALRRELRDRGVAAFGLAA